MGYIVGHPIKHPKDFYGRSHEVEHFYDVVAGDQAQSVNILGLRRSGKTSFLQYIAHTETMSRYLVNPQYYIMVYQDISICKDSVDFYRRILSQLQRILKKRRPEQSWQLPTSGQATIHDLEAFLLQYPDYRFILLLDEFDRLRTGQFDPNFLSELRALTIHWEYELACVTASYWDVYQLGEYINLLPTSPFYNIFYPAPIILRGLEESESTQLIKTPAQEAGYQFDAQEIAEIQCLAGSLPFFIQAVAAYYLQLKKSGESVTTEQLQHQFIVNLSTYYNQWWQQFSNLERDLLKRVALQKPLQQLPYNSDEISITKDRFNNLGLIQETQAGLAINGEVCAHWLIKHAGRNRQFSTTPIQSRANPKARDRNVPTLATPLYTEILTAIQDVGKQFERMPATYSQKGEEDLRDHMLLVLEPRFEGSATGETFNKTGKTDIMIRNRGSNVFIGECKFWKGTRVYLETIDQLLGYLTWRDSKAAVLMFVRNKEFSPVLKTVEQVTTNHPNFLEYFGKRDESWFDYRFHLQGDSDREVKVAVMLFHIPRVK